MELIIQLQTKVAVQFGDEPSYSRTPSKRRRRSTTIAVALATLRQAWYRENPDTAMRVRIVDVQLVCNSHYFSQLAAFFIDPRAK